MKLTYQFVLSILLFCSVTIVFSQNLSDQETGFDAARITAELKKRGVADQDIPNEIAIARKIYNKQYAAIKKKENEILQEISTEPTLQAKTNKTASLGLTLQTTNTLVADIPQTEKDALLALYNSTTGNNWYHKNGWDFNTPVTSWNSTQTGWWGITVTDGHITEINLSSNNLKGPIPIEIGQLTELKTLLLYANQLNGTIPAEIGQLTQLQILDLSLNYLTGEIPPQIGQLAKLKFLYLNSNQLSGSLPSQIGQLTNLSALSLDYNQLSGRIPPELGQLTSLNNLGLSYNQLSGWIPPEIQYLTKLNDLSLDYNQITGITTEIKYLKQLQELYLSFNKISNIPPEIGQLSNLLNFYIDHNQLSGSLPPGILELPLIDQIHVNGNQLSGTLMDLGPLSTLTELFIDQNNFRFVDFAYQFSSLKDRLSLGFNYAPQAKTDSEITINKSTGETQTLTMYEDNSFTPQDTYQWYKNRQLIPGATTRQYTLANLTLGNAGDYYCVSTNPQMTLSSDDGQNLILTRNTIHLNVSVVDIPQTEKDALLALYNSTNGNNWTNKTGWDFSTPVTSWNSQTQTGWTGILVQEGHVVYINLSNNKLTGYLPTEIGQLTKLNSLFLDDNQLTGWIPPGFGELLNLQVISLQNNQITGITTEIKYLKQLQELYLSNNKISNIPDEIGQLSNLWNFYIDHNQLSGSLPQGILELPKIDQIHLNDNQLSGNLINLGLLTTLNELIIGQNNLRFVDFTSQFSTLKNNVLDFYYSHQSKTDSEITINKATGETQTLTMYEDNRFTSQDTYQWYKNGQPISGATSRQYTLANLTLTNAGDYYCVSTNPQMTLSSDDNQNLILTRNTIHLNVSVADIPQTEKDALLAFYNSTNGSNWRNKTGWDFNTPVTSWDNNNKTGWYGITVENSHVVEIFLSSNNLSGTLPVEIGQFSNLKTLITVSNKLTGNIPSQIGLLSNLTFLNLSSNDLSGEIPKEIGQLQKLKTFYLSSTNIKGFIPPEIGQLKNLETLGLLGNRLSGNIPSQIGELTALKDLNLTSNKLEGNIPLSIGNLINLEYLDLSYNTNLNGTIPQQIKNLSNLKNLNLISNQFEGNIPDLTNLEFLEFLDFSRNKFIYSDFNNEFTIYKNRLQSSFRYSPQAKTDTPKTITATIGTTVNLTMFEDKESTLNDTFQWYKNGQPILGATSRQYTLANLTLANAGDYYCVSTNSQMTLSSYYGQNLILTRNTIHLNINNCNSVLNSSDGTDKQTICISNPISPITYTTSGLITGATFSGLPSGVTGNFASNTVTISGTPAYEGTFPYTITYLGDCGNTINTTGTITVMDFGNITLSSAVGTDDQYKKVNTAITPVTYNTTAANEANILGLPAGVSYSFVSNVITISGTPTVTGIFNYRITLTGNCDTSITGKITASCEPITGEIKIITNTSNRYDFSGLGKSSAALACQEAIFPLKYYAATTTLNVNTKLYSNESLTLPVNGGNLWYQNKINSISYKIDSSGNIVETYSCTTPPAQTGFPFKFSEPFSMATSACAQTEFPVTLYASSTTFDVNTQMYYDAELTQKVVGSILWQQREIDHVSYEINENGKISGSYSCNTTPTNNSHAFQFSWSSTIIASACSQTEFPVTMYAAATTLYADTQMYWDAELTEKVFGSTTTWYKLESDNILYRVDDEGIILGTHSCNTTTNSHAFQFSNSDSTATLACSQVTFPLTLYSASATLGIGTQIYSDINLTTSVVGDDLWYKSADSGVTYRIDNSGQIVETSNCAKWYQFRPDNKIGSAGTDSVIYIDIDNIQQQYILTRSSDGPGLCQPIYAKSIIQVNGATDCNYGNETNNE